MSSQGTVITTPTQIVKGGVEAMVINWAVKHELESYKNIIQNLSRLKVEASERNHGEAEAIGQIRANLLDLRDSL